MPTLPLAQPVEMWWLAIPEVCLPGEGTVVEINRISERQAGCLTTAARPGAPRCPRGQLDEPRLSSLHPGGGLGGRCLPHQIGLAQSAHHRRAGVCPLVKQVRSRAVEPNST
jgi:hypothetical protein